MYKRYFRKKNPDCRTEEIEWIEMTGKEFLAFVNAPCNAGRFFIDMDDVVLECTEAEHQAYRSEVNHHNYLMEQEEGWETVSLYCLEPDTGCNGEEVIADETQDVEMQTIKNLSIKELRKVWQMLSDEEFQVIYSLYLAEDKKTIRQLSSEMGIPTMTLWNRNHAVLEALGNALRNSPKKIRKTFGTNPKKVSNRK